MAGRRAVQSGRLGVVWLGVVWLGVVWLGVVWLGVVWLGVVWLGVVWLGVVWLGVVWLGVVWLGVVWLGVVWLVQCRPRAAEQAGHWPQPLRAWRRSAAASCIAGSSWSGRPG